MYPKKKNNEKSNQLTKSRTYLQSNSSYHNTSLRSNSSTGRFLKGTVEKITTERNDNIENNEIKVLPTDNFFIANLQAITKLENKKNNSNNSLKVNKSTLLSNILSLKNSIISSQHKKDSIITFGSINGSKRRSSVIHILNVAKKYFEKENNKEINISPEELDNIIKESVKKSKRGKFKLIIKYIDITLAILVTANIFFSLIENELFYKETKIYLKVYFSDKENKEITRDVYKQCEKRPISDNENFFRKINLIIIFFLLLFNFTRYYLILLLKEIEGLISEKDGFWSTGLWKYLLCETIVLGIFDPPNLNFFFTGTMENNIFAFSLGGLICIETMFKCYIIVRVYSYYSKYLTESAKSLCNNSGANGGIHFALKCELKSRPFTMLIFVFISAILLFAFSLRTFEYFSVEKGFIYGSYTGQGNDQDKLKDLINSIWITIVTMTTVGYGDFYPSENYGRLICILSYLIGCILISLTVVSLAIVSEFSENEKKAYSIIKKLNAENNVILKASEVISSLCLLRMKIMEKNNKLSERFVYIMKLKQSINTFKNDFKIASSMTLPIDQTFNIIFKGINNNYDNICNNISQLKNINQFTFRIHLSQKNTLKKINKIIKRQQKLGNYLVEFNNEIFKRSIATFTFSPSNVHFQKSECKN